MLPGLGKQVLSTCKILPDLESLKCNNFYVLSVSYLKCHHYAEIHEEFNTINRFRIAHTEQKIHAII